MLSTEPHRRVAKHNVPRVTQRASHNPSHEPVERPRRDAAAEADAKEGDERRVEERHEQVVPVATRSLVRLRDLGAQIAIS